jgi:hypothetical protein
VDGPECSHDGARYYIQWRFPVQRVVEVPQGLWQVSKLSLHLYSQGSEQALMISSLIDLIYF